MASYHLSVKVGKSGMGAAHANYIVREGKYASKSKDDLEHKEFGNMPYWVEKIEDFWRAADEYERKNGAIYRELEIALPRELNHAQRLELVHEFIASEIGERHAYTFAIHNPRAAIDDGEQPHAHIMYTERIFDNINRPAEQYFKRWNAKNPECGGCKKANTPKTVAERKAALMALRERFASLQNKHLTRHGHTTQVTAKSLKKQGITDRIAEPHLGPKLAKEMVKDVRESRIGEKITAMRVAAELIKTGKELALRAAAQVAKILKEINGKIRIYEPVFTGLQHVKHNQYAAGWHKLQTLSSINLDGLHGQGGRADNRDLFLPTTSHANMERGGQYGAERVRWSNTRPGTAQGGGINPLNQANNSFFDDDQGNLSAPTP